MIVKSDQGDTTNIVQLASGTNAAPLRFNASIPVNIPDNDPNGTNSPIVVSNISGAIVNVTVSLYITHTYDSDLVLQLVSPDGITNTLSKNHGGFGQNYGSSCSPDARWISLPTARSISTTQSSPSSISWSPARTLR